MKYAAVKYAAVIMLLILSACGVDGAPERPDPDPSPGVSVSGDARIGVRVDGI
ncbi:MAG: hypothetical protein ACK5II_03215 [Paracoccus sp. (in: a-proteobacteria)]